VRGAWTIPLATDDRCRNLVAAVDALTAQIEDFQQALAAGEIPAPPRTPARVAQVEAFIHRLIGAIICLTQQPRARYPHARRPWCSDMRHGRRMRALRCNFA
jgi:hypothetical protein